MLAALEAGDGRRYAELARSSTLYLPTLADGAQADWPEGLPGVDDEHALVFTSPVTLFRALAGHVRGYEETTFEGLGQRWPGPDTQVLLNAGTPIGVFLTIKQITDLAEGTESLVPVSDVQDAIVDGVIEDVRARCLADLGSDGDVAARVMTTVSPNALETALEKAVESVDFDAFLLALLDSEVVVLTTEAVPDPSRIAERDFPWRVVGEEEAPVVPVFSSAEVLDVVVPGGHHRVQVPFLDLVAAWPSQEYLLCFNPGTATELTLPAGGVPELAAAVAEAASGDPS